MKICFFHLMPYRFLPEDFENRYRSVWVDVPHHLYDPEKTHGLYHEFLDELEFAEAQGFDGLCVNEHHNNAYGLMPSPNLMAAALTRRTSRAAIIVLGNSLAAYNPPLRVAEEFAMLDLLSRGRLVAGFPVGTSMDMNFAYGIDPTTLRDRYHEAHDLVIQAWTRPEVFAFNGKYTQVRYVNIWPQPLQKPHPPVWIPGGGSVETWEWTAKLDYVYCYLSYYGYKRGKATMDGFWEAIARVGADDNPYRAGFLQLVCVADTDAEAERLYFPHVHYFYQKCLNVWEGFAEAPGYRTVKTLQTGTKPQVGAQAKKIRQSLDWQQYLDQGYVIAGSPATVRAQLTECVKSLRVGHLMVLLQIGWSPFLDHLAARYTVLAPFHPGVQGSSGVETLDDVLDLVLAYDELLDRLGVGAAHLVGHFFGGMVAAELAATLRPRAAKLVLISPLGLWRDDAPSEDLLILPHEDLPAVLFRDPASAVARGWATLPAGEEQNIAAQIESIQRRAAMAKFVWPIPDRGLKKRLHRITAPTLVLWGEADRANPLVYAEEWQRRVKGAALSLLPGGHMVLHEVPDAAAAVVAEFLGT